MLGGRAKVERSLPSDNSFRFLSLTARSASDFSEFAVPTFQEQSIGFLANSRYPRAAATRGGHGSA